jgi:hypothetical protein
VTEFGREKVKGKEGDKHESYKEMQKDRKTFLQPETVVFLST